MKEAEVGSWIGTKTKHIPLQAHFWKKMMANGDVKSSKIRVNIAHRKATTLFLMK